MNRLRWLRRNPGWWIMLIGALLAGVLVASVYLAVLGQRDDLTATQHERDRAIATLQRDEQQIKALTAEVALLRQDSQANAAQIAANNAEIAALSEQVRQLGGKPVIVNITPTTTSPPRSTTTTTAPRPATTTTTTPCLVQAAGRCVRSSSAG